MNRVILVNLDCSPTREQLGGSERRLGAEFLHGLDAEYAGYITVSGAMKLAAQWLVPIHSVPTLATRIRDRPVPGYQIQLFVDSDGSPVRII